MKPVRSSFPTPSRRAVVALPLCLSPLAVPWPPSRCPCRRLPCSGRPSAVLVAACRAVLLLKPNHYTRLGSTEGE